MIFSAKKDDDKAIYFFSKSMEENRGNKQPYLRLAEKFTAKGDQESAKKVMSFSQFAQDEKRLDIDKAFDLVAY